MCLEDCLVLICAFVEERARSQKEQKLVLKKLESRLLIRYLD